jgi:hypothetical protein
MWIPLNYHEYNSIDERRCPICYGAIEINEGGKYVVDRYIYYMCLKESCRTALILRGIKNADRW